MPYDAPLLALMMKTKPEQQTRSTGRIWRRGLGWLAIGILLAGNLFIGARLYSGEVRVDGASDAYEYMELFTRVIEQVRLHYVDDEKISYKNLIYGALDGMLQSLDPHSSFLDPDAYGNMRDDTEGHFGGLGIVIAIRDGVLTIVTPIEDTPGFREGLLAGDKIIEIEGESTDGLSIEEAVKYLRGEPGTRVTIKILRPSTQEIKDVTVTRAYIDVPSVKDERIIEDGIGYVRITQFSQPTGDKLQEALDRLIEEGLEALIIDLRNNPGGLLRSAVDVSQKFIPRGEMVVYTQGRDERDRQTFLARGRTHYEDWPLVILINKGSASASEIVAGALQDHRRAILIGETTFGKGSVQSVLPQEDGSALRLTTAKYYTPSRRVIHEHGIEPNIVVPMSAAEWQELLIQRSRPETLEPPSDEISIEDRQLVRAVDVLKGILAFRNNGKHAGTEP